MPTARTACWGTIATATVVREGVHGEVPTDADEALDNRRATRVTGHTTSDLFPEVS
jgi:hypothetical protein